MIRNIIMVLLLVVVVVPSWQVGGILMQKKKTGYVLQEQVNKIKRVNATVEHVKNETKKELEALNLPTDFKIEELERFKVKIIYQYVGSATLFDYTYYQTSELFEVVTAAD